MDYMEKNTWNNLSQSNNIVKLWKTKLVLSSVKNNLANGLENKYQSKKNKLCLLGSGDYKTIKYAPDSIKSSNDNREIIDEAYNKIDVFYAKCWIDQEYLDNAKNFIDTFLAEDFIDNRRFYKAMQLINWCRFLVVSNIVEWEDRYIHLEMKKLSSEDKFKLLSEYNFDEKRLKRNRFVIFRHVDKQADLDSMAESFLEWKENIINKIDDYKNVDLVKSSTWFWDKDFIHWWKEKRKDQRKDSREEESSSIIKLFGREFKYSYWLWKNKREDWFWRKHMMKGSPLDLSIEEYQKECKTFLAEGERIIDLVKMKELEGDSTPPKNTKNKCF